MDAFRKISRSRLAEAKMRSRTFNYIALALILFTAGTCKDNNRVHPERVEYVWNFNSGTDGWTADFAGYPVGEESFYALQFGHDTLPPPLNQEKRALRLTGTNHNKNLFMFVKRKLTGLDPNTIYYITFTVEFASNEPADPAALENEPNDGVHIAAGASMPEPLKVVGENSNYSMNIGQCSLNKDGEDMIVLGNFYNDTEQDGYHLKTLTNKKPFHRTTDEKGELWIIVGSHSNLEATTTIYYNAIKAELF